MFIVFPIVCAVLIVTVGYFALWTSSTANTPKGVASFGMILATILYVIAAIVLVCGLVYGPRMHMDMMHRMGGWNSMEMKENKGSCGMMENKESKEMMEKEPMKKDMMKK